MTSPWGMPPIPDRDLIAAVLRGQVDAFASLLGRHRDTHTRFAIRMLGGYASADDALQAAFLRAFRSLKRCEDPDQFDAWLARIVINEVRAFAMRRSVRARATGEMAAIVAGGPAPKGASDAAAEIQRALDQIDPINREAFVLQYVEEMSYEEISALTATSVPALETRVDRACARLRELLERMYTEHRNATSKTVGDAHDPGVPFVVHIATPLRRPEVLNDTFEDRLMAKLLRPGETGEPTTGPTSETVPQISQSVEVEPTRAVESDPPRISRPAVLGAAAGLIIASFGAGYLLHGKSAPPDEPTVTLASSTPAPPLAVAPESVFITRTDTVRVVRQDTLHLARFVYVDAAARSVALVGDFNKWNKAATPLARAVTKGTWSVSVPLSSGRHAYAFVVDGKRRATDSLSTTPMKPAATTKTLSTPAPASAKRAATTPGPTRAPTTATKKTSRAAAKR